MKEIPPKEYHLQIPHNAEDSSAIDRTEKAIEFFEKQIISIHHLMISRGYLPSLDAIRRAAEEVDGMFASGHLPDNIPQFLRNRAPRYGERRVLAVEEVFCEMGLITPAALQQNPKDIKAAALEPEHPTPVYAPRIETTAYPKPSFAVGDRVQVSADSKSGHIRVPAYLLGKTGTIASFQGMFLNPEEVAHFSESVLRLPLYQVEFSLKAVWGEACPTHCTNDKLRAEIYEPWLSRST